MVSFLFIPIYCFYDLFVMIKNSESIFKFLFRIFCVCLPCFLFSRMQFDVFNAGRIESDEQVKEGNGNDNEIPLRD